MAKSFARGDYKLVMAFESASSAGNWYRVLEDRQSHALSCDCPAWIHAGQRRACKHTQAAAQLRTEAMAPAAVMRGWLGRMVGRAAAGLPAPTTPHEQLLVTAIRDQWPGLSGTWGISEQETRVGSDRYHVVRIALAPMDGPPVQALAAFGVRHSTATARLIPGVAGWIGYHLAAQVAQNAGFAQVGAPPEHYRFKKRKSGETRVALADILRVADRTDLGDGLTPAERAENTLRLFLGDLYPTLQAQGFLDVSSARYTAEQRVYRLRRSARSYPRRIRVFERGQYVRDLCVVPRIDAPEADHFLTVFLQLMSDEESVLAVVRQHNIFPPFSDSQDRESLAAIWTPRGVAQAA